MKTFARAVSALILSAAALPLAAQQPAEQSAQLVERLREIVDRPVTTEAGAAQRSADSAAWLEASADVDLGEAAILRAIARKFSADAGERVRCAGELMQYLAAHDAKLPVEGFAKVAGDVVLFDLVRRADAGEWGECEELLPLLLRACRDHRSVFWLLGRRGRDAGTEEGRAFLQGVVIPALLADHELDDADRVHVLRLYYAVEYTGPKPFVHVSGPGLDGGEVRTADRQGKVLLVDYWATWCRPCLMAMPGVVAAHRKFHDRGFEVVGISLDEADRRELVLAKVRELGMDWPTIFDGAGGESAIARANKVLAIPATFLIDRAGRVRYTGLEGDELEERVAELLAER